MKKLPHKNCLHLLAEYFCWKLIVRLLDSRKTLCNVPHMRITRFIHFLTTVGGGGEDLKLCKQSETPLILLCYARQLDPRLYGFLFLNMYKHLLCWRWNADTWKSVTPFKNGLSVIQIWSEFFFSISWFNWVG
jgi:hypothetical protein